MTTSCCIQVPQSRLKGHVDRLRAEEKWQSRARLTETSFTFLEAQESEASSQLPLLPKKKTAEEVEDWHFEKPHVCINFILYIIFIFFTVLTFTFASFLSIIILWILSIIINSTGVSSALICFKNPSYIITGGVGLVFPVGSVWVAALAGEQPTSGAQRPAGAQRALQPVKCRHKCSAHAQCWLPGSCRHSKFAK